MPTSEGHYQNHPENLGQINDKHAMLVEDHELATKITQKSKSLTKIKGKNKERY
jgi:hypothetical protein